MRTSHPEHTSDHAAARSCPGIAIPEQLGPEKESLADFTVKERKAPVINWYRTPLPKELFKELHQKDDRKGAFLVFGHLGLRLALAAAAVGSSIYFPWPVTVAILFCFGTVAAFDNGVHELGHATVFKSKAANRFFCRIFAFLGWFNHETFNASHTRHHRYTLHPPDDLEVVLPLRLMVRHFLLTGFVDPVRAWKTFLTHVRIARGKFEGEWELTLYPPDDPDSRSAPVRWSRTVLAGHGLIALAAVATGQWIVLPLVTFAPFYASWLFFLCNNTQHIGLQDFVPDFRLCCRTFTLSPFVRFLYWNMNYHTEHHMYAAVPSYHLARLHAAIRHDLPPTPHGLVAVWKQIAEIQARQEKDPSYQFQPELPAPRAAAAAA